jgi:putative ABC transport system permease protein
MNAPVAISYYQIVLAALLILINGAISALLGLNLGRRLFLAAACTVVQLLLVGLILEWVFRLNRWYLVLGLMSFMTVMGGSVSIQRVHFRYPGIWLTGLVSVWASSWMMAAVAIFVIVPARPWYSPQYAIPLLGMILGNTLNGISLGLDRLGSELAAKRSQVETLLALGATRWEAARQPVQQAIRTGMIPIINSMMVVGIVSLPGMLTGQLLVGVSPIQAVKYQIVIMFLIASGTALGTVGVVLLSYLRLFSHNHQFLYQRIQAGTEAIDLGRSPVLR